MTHNQDPLAGLKAATEHLTKDTPEEIAKATIKSSLVFLLNLSPLELEDAIDYLKTRRKLPASWWNALKNEVKQKRSQSKKQNAKAEFGELKEVNRVHPAVDFPGGGQAMVLGFRVDLPENETASLFIVSDDQGVRAEINPDTLKINNTIWQVGKGTPAWLKDVWSLDKAKTTLANHIRPQTLFQALKDTLVRFLDMQDPAYGLLAAWATGTYFAHAFAAYPFLHLYGPKETGKSKTLEALSCISFNSWKGRDITAAALGDTCEGLRGTLLIDQAERLGSQDQNGGGNLVGLLADSYKKAGGKRRVVEVSKAGRTVLEFSTYGPKAFASTKQLDPDLGDRCVRIPMTRTRQRLPDLEGWEPVWAELRDKLYRFALSAFKEVIQNYHEIKGDGTRIGELWRPLGAVLKALGVDQGVIEPIRILFMAGAIDGQHELTAWESILFEVLKEKAGYVDSFEMTAEEILAAMDIEGEHQPGVKWIGNSLSRFSLYSKRLARKYTDDRKRKVQPYLFESGHVLKMYEIYLRDTPQNEASQASQGEINNDCDPLTGTEANLGTCPKASQGEEKHDMGRNGTGPVTLEGPMEQAENTDKTEVGRMGRENLEGIPEKKSTPNGDEEPLGEVIL